MPKRKPPLVNKQIYHVFNRGNNKKPIFNCKRDYKRAISLMNYYKYKKTPLRYSNFQKQSKKQKELIYKLKKLKGDKKIEIICYCLMPNHMHFLLKQIVNNGISNFMQQFQNSYARYFNIKNNNTGSLFEGRFKAVRIEDDKQLVHVSRYIHLNPYSGFIVGNANLLETFPWSSFPEYIAKRKKDTCTPNIVLNMFEKKEQYAKFTLNYANYQKNLKKITHLILEPSKIKCPDVP